MMKYIYPDRESVRWYYWWITEWAVIKWHSLYLMYDCREYILGHLCCHHISSHTMLQSSLSVWPALGIFPPHSNTQMSTHTACYNWNNLNKWSHRPPKHVFLHIIWRWYPPCAPPGFNYPLPTSHPLSVSCLPWAISPGWGGQDRTGEDKLQPQSPNSLSCFHLHQQLISHHWRALACQAEDFIRDVLYGP